MVDEESARVIVMSRSEAPWGGSILESIEGAWTMMVPNLVETIKIHDSVEVLSSSWQVLKETG